MTSTEVASNAVAECPAEPALAPPQEPRLDCRVLSDRPRASRGTWPCNFGGFLAASSLLHIAALAAAVQNWPSGLWQLRLPTGHNQVALAASVSSPKSEGETKIRVEQPSAEAVDEPLSRREAELPAEASAQFASVTVDARVPPPAEMTRRDAEESPKRPDRPISKPPKKVTNARLPPRETALQIESPASAPSLQSSGVRESLPPTAVVMVKPVYPPVALAGGLQGVVKLRVLVNSKGEVTAASLHESSGHDLLDQAALEAILHCRYTPPNGESGIAAEFVQIFTFRIPDATNGRPD